jgi:phosphate-selective porin OprO and OprP
MSTFLILYYDEGVSRPQSILHIQGDFMIFIKKSIRYLLVLTVLVLPIGSALGQGNQSSSEPSSRNEKPDGPTEQSQTAIENRELKLKVEKLLTAMEQQQQLLLELKKRVDELENKPSVALATPAALTPPTTGERSATQSTPQSSPTNQNSRANGSTTTAQNSTQPGNPQQGQNPGTGQNRPIAGWDLTGAYLRSPDGSFETRIGGFAQFDFRGYQAGDHPPNTYAVRRARIRLEGTLNRYFDYRVEGEMADTTSILLRDFYVRIDRFEKARLTLGQFREPFSQEELRPEPSQDFVEKSLVNLLAPARSPGIMLSGIFNRGVFEYQLGSFNGKGMLRDNNNGTPENALRLRFSPWRNGQAFWLKGLAFGGAFAHGKNIGGTSLRGQTASRSFTFFTPEAVNGTIIRANAELTWLLGPAALRVEFDQTNQDRDNLGLAGSNLPGVVAKGYMAQFTYLLTGETKSANGATTPKHGLFSTENGKLGLGAFEFKARFDDLQIANGSAKSNRSQTLYVGGNWYMNRFLKHMLDFGFERFQDPLRSPKPGDKNFFVILSRLQVTF